MKEPTHGRARFPLQTAFSLAMACMLAVGFLVWMARREVSRPSSVSPPPSSKPPHPAPPSAENTTIRAPDIQVDVPPTPLPERGVAPAAGEEIDAWRRDIMRDVTEPTFPTVTSLTTPSGSGVSHSAISDRAEAARQWLLKLQMGPTRRNEAVKALSRAKGTGVVHLLLGLAELAETSVTAIQTLGRVPIHNPALRGEALHQLRRYIARPLNWKQECAALETLGRLGGEEVFPELAHYVRDNMRRADGMGMEVCSAAVRGIGAIGSPQAEQWLTTELRRVLNERLLHDYGSVVVAELARYKNPTTQAALRDYGNRLLEEAARPINVGNPAAYLREKAKEALLAADGAPIQPPSS